MTNVIITGGSGLLGKYLKITEPFDINSLYVGNMVRADHIVNLDLMNELNIHRLVSDHKPDIIIHCAAMGNVDYAEENPQIAHDINVGMTAKLIEITKPYSPLFIYISSNAVYDGNNPPYSENSPQNPINVYGRTKKRAEQVVREHCLNWLIVRPFMLFGHSFFGGRKNWYTIIRKSIYKQEKLTLVNDVIWQPTSARFLAETIWSLVSNNVNNEGFNISQGRCMSLYDFGFFLRSLLVPHANLIAYKIEAIESVQLSSIAPRPIDTSYDIQKTREFLDDNIPTLEHELAYYGYEEYRQEMKQYE